ncbi:hypothetical protein GTN27_08225 [Ochrobactrum sp. EEELCW01]|nr:hypothetical protein GTN27_08225 [Ochrobactrum sp. EEELCW01]
MHIYAFKVEGVAGNATTTTFSEVVDYIVSLPLKKRFSLGIRLETAKTVGPDKELHFLKLRETALPGKATLLKPAQSLGLQPDEALSEETAGILRQNSSTLILQGNHYGPRKGSIEAYMAHFAPLAAASLGRTGPGANEGFLITHIVNQAVQAELNRKTIFKSIDVTLSNPPASQVLHAAGTSLGEILDMGVTGGSKSATIKLSAGRKKDDTIVPKVAKRIITKLMGTGYDVESLKVKAKDNSGAETEILDLLNAVVRTKIDVAPGPDRELPRGMRIKALREAMAAWAKQGLI